MGGFISAHFFYVRGLIFCNFFLNLAMRRPTPPELRYVRTQEGSYHWKMGHHIE